MLREEFDDWAILFNPDTGHGFGLSPTGVYMWKLLDGEHTVDELLKEIRFYADKVPEEAGDHVAAFIDELVAEGLATSGNANDGILAALPPAQPTSIREVSRSHAFVYEPPTLVDLSRGFNAQGASYCTQGSSASTECHNGNGAAGGGGWQQGNVGCWVTGSAATSLCEHFGTAAGGAGCDGGSSGPCVYNVMCNYTGCAVIPYCSCGDAGQPVEC